LIRKVKTTITNCARIKGTKTSSTNSRLSAVGIRGTSKAKTIAVVVTRIAGRAQIIVVGVTSRNCVRNSAINLVGASRSYALAVNERITSRGVASEARIKAAQDAITVVVRVGTTRLCLTSEANTSSSIIAKVASSTEIFLPRCANTLDGTV